MNMTTEKCTFFLRIFLSLGKEVSGKCGSVGWSVRFVPFPVKAHMYLGWGFDTWKPISLSLP